MQTQSMKDAANSLMFCTDGKRRHIVLFYENENSALDIKCQFISTALSNREYCIFLTAKSVRWIEKALRDYGIDVHNLKKDGVLDIHKVTWPEDAGKTDYDIEKVKGFLCQKPQVSKRIVGFHTTDATVKHDVDAGISIEQYCKSIFGDINCSMLCSHYVKKFPLKERARWMVEMLKIHDSAIFVDKKGLNQVIEL